jgi:ABC-2 type transport system permease protein
MTSIGVVALPVHLTAYRERGVLRRFRASSISVWALLGSQLLVSSIIAVLGSVLIVVLAMVSYSSNLPQSPALVIFAFILGTLCFAVLGFFLGSILPSPRAAQGLGLLLFFVMIMLGGAGPPREVFTEAMRFVSDITPVRYVVLMLQDPWLGFGWNVSASLIVVGITVAAALLSARFFRWE